MKSVGGWRLIGLSLGAVVAFSVLAPALATSPVPVFTNSTVATRVFAPEPAVAVDRTTNPNHIYVSSTPHSIWDGITSECCTQVRPLVGPEGEHAFIWRSADGGQTFSGPVSSGGWGGGSDIAVDALGQVFVVETYDSFNRDTLPISASVDRGQTFACCTVTNLHYNPFFSCYKRPFIAARGNAHIVVTAQCGNTLDAFVMPDGQWNNIQGPITIATDVILAGKPVFSPANGNHVYVPYIALGQLRIARSINGGQTWSTRLISPGRGDKTYPAAAVDQAGNVYVVRAYAELAVDIGFDGRVTLFVSTNTGINWSGAYTLSDTTRSSIFPWVTAGAAGKVAVAYYTARNVGGVDPGPDISTPATSWDVEIVQSLNADQPSKQFTRSVAVSGFHTGSICTIGFRYCNNRDPFTSGPNAPLSMDGRLGDFFTIDNDSLGNLIIPYPKDRAFTDEPIYTRSDLTVARQIDGPRIR